MINPFKKKLCLMVIFLVLFFSLVVSGCTTQEKQARFEYSNLELSKDELVGGGSVEVSVDVKNVGEVRGQKEVELYVNGQPHVGKTVNLSSGEEKTIQLTLHSPVPPLNTEPEEIIGWNISIGNLTETLDRLLPARFRATNLEVTETELEPGENTTISTEIKNIGDVKGTKTIKLFIDNEVEKTKEITLNPKEETTTSFQFQKQELGNYTIEISYTFNINNLTKTIKVQKPPKFEVNNLDINPFEVETGETVTVSVDVENNGGEQGTKTIEFIIGDETITRDITLEGGETDTFSVSVSKDSEGIYDVVVSGMSDTFSVLSPSNANVSVSVFSVIDGDTVEIEYRNGTKDTVRLLGVDTPEVYSDNSPSEFEGISNSSYLRQWGYRASNYTKTALMNETITLRFDNESDKRGYFDRLLAYIYLENDSCLNKLLIVKGFARVYEEAEFTKKQLYLEVEERARENYTGLWQKLNETKQKTNDSLVIVDARFDAPGNDHNNPNGEWIKIKNKGTETKNLKGHRLTDADGHVYFFPNTSLAKGESLFVYSGVGENNETALYWGSETAIWNNEGDTAYLYNSTDSLIDSYKDP